MKPNIRILAIAVAVLAVAIIYYFWPKTVVVSVAQPDATVVYKGKQQSAPATIKHRTGKATLEIGAKDYETELVTFYVSWLPKQTEVISLSLPSEQVRDDAAVTDQQFPLINKLPQLTANYSVDLNETTGVFVITLFATLNRPEQLETYQQQLNKYGQEAIDWIKSEGSDPSKMQIEWLPEKPAISY